jgi:hypothetical protein
MFLRLAPIPVYDSVYDACQGESERQHIAKPDLNIKNSKHDKHLAVFRIFTITRETRYDPVPYLKKKLKMTNSSAPLSVEVSRAMVISNTNNPSFLILYIRIAARSAPGAGRAAIEPGYVPPASFD